ncbi:hypothetical protein BDQ12DRAFT_723652 [Crucibulum laeve]|uniref:Uncharacterized protein n=1 Tax=Crucibulum laeve TaxID=68775 RepID=A0A5C3M1V9_9AGAR|nr:hypothetical protein BDQ12DRAFT_723652 [Crucibulum laeve]
MPEAWPTHVNSTSSLSFSSVFFDTLTHFIIALFSCVFRFFSLLSLSEISQKCYLYFKSTVLS